MILFAFATITSFEFASVSAEKYERKFELSILDIDNKLIKVNMHINKIKVMYLDKDDIINLDECKAIENCMICTICDGVVYQPLQCVKCENLFCRNCIEEWRKNQIHVRINVKILS